MVSIAATKPGSIGSIVNSTLANDFPTPSYSSNESIIAAIGYSKLAEPSAVQR
jgi:hypothetical protein